MEEINNLLIKNGFLAAEAYDLPTSEKRFPDGAQYRVEIPSVEGPEAMKATIEEGKKLGVPIHRISQGSGIMLLTDAEIKEMVELAEAENIELSLFVGPRGTWDISAQPLTKSGQVIALRHEGIDQLGYAMKDLYRGASLGLKGALVADEGLLLMTKKMKEAGLLPKDFVVKVSVQMMAANPVSVKIIEDLGADTYNVPTALTLPKLASIRNAINIPIDLYIETPDNFGGFLRYYEIPEIIRVLAPVYIKFGLKNHPDVYPSGKHLVQTNIELCKERVHRAKIGMEMIERYAKNTTMSKIGAEGLGVPSSVPIETIN